jgi:60 kDa SS-A/Ro ribonucleoprotein
VVAFTATSYSIADPNDGGMLDVVGFDSAAPSVRSQLAAG